MTHHARLQREPAFEPPPRIGDYAERRLAARAAAAWAAQWRAETLPRAAGFSAGEEPGFAAHSLLLDVRAPALTRVIAVGDAVADTFGLIADRRLGDAPGSVAALLGEACDALRLTREAVPVQGAVAGVAAVCLLTRGIVLPLADERGRLAVAQAVLNWKEMLDAPASLRLRAELARGIAAVRQAPPPRDAFGGLDG